MGRLDRGRLSVCEGAQGGLPTCTVSSTRSREEVNLCSDVLVSCRGRRARGPSAGSPLVFLLIESLGLTGSSRGLTTRSGQLGPKAFAEFPSASLLHEPSHSSSSFWASSLASPFSQRPVRFWVGQRWLTGW